MNQLLNHWSVDLASISLLACFGLLYGFAGGWRIRAGAGLYVSGLLLALFVQISPLHFLGMHYLMSAHMVGHILLLLVCGPLLLLGLPAQSGNKAARLLENLSDFFRQRPWAGWLIGLGVMWVWHIPAVYDMTVAHSTVAPNGTTIPLCTLAGSSTNWFTLLLPILHPVSLLLAGMCFVWPIIGPLPEYRMQPLTGVVYLFTACACCSLLGVLITFAPMGLYAAYPVADYTGLTGFIRDEWGFDRATDQQVAGLLMWVPGCFIYVGSALYLLGSALADTDEPRLRQNTSLLLENDNQ